jgi:hypothetical protein
MGTLILLGLFLLAQSVGAGPSAAPLAQGATTLLSYQGTLTDKDGNPVNGNVEMVFALYYQAEGGTSFWSESYTGADAVEVTDGQFHVLLGSRVALNPADLTGDLYLGITTNGEEMTPREQLTSVVNAVQTRFIDGDLDMRHHHITNLGIGNVNFSIGDATGIGNAHFTLHEGSQFAFRWIDDQGDDHYAFQIGKSEIVARQTVNMYGNSITGAANVHAGNIYGHGGQEIHMPGGLSGIYFNWHQGGSAHFGGGDGYADVSISPTGINMHGNSIVNCGALTEANLQTPKELAAGRIDRFSEGDVLCWSPESDRLEKCAVANDRLVQAVADPDGRPIVIGAEVVKVRGPVQAGDILVASGVPGYAMVNNDPHPGTVIAQTLEDFHGERGLVKAMIRKW